MSIYDIYKRQDLTITLKPTNSIIRVKCGTKPIDILDKFQNYVGTYSNNQLLSLQEQIDIDSVLEPIQAGHPDSIDMLRDTICFLLQCAACNVFPGLCLKQKFDLFGSLYFRFDDLMLNSNDIQAIINEMERIIGLNLPINRVIVTYHQIVDELTALNHREARHLVQTLNNPVESVAEILLPHAKHIKPVQQTESVSVTPVSQLIRNDSNSSSPFHLLWKSPLLPSSGLCRGLYQIQKYSGGFLLHCSKDFQPVSTIPVTCSAHFQEQIFNIMNNYIEQAARCGLGSVASVNTLVSVPKALEEMMTYSEFNIEKQISEVAARVTNRTKVIFLAGPSSSGKTTTANRIACHLRSRGYEPLRVSMDDYYDLVDNVPRIEGTDNPDFEHLESLRLDKLQENLTDLVNGCETVLPRYDFKKQMYSDGRRYRLPKSGILIIEGIHALNDRITSFVPDENKIRIFIQPIGSLSWDETRTIDYYMSRLMRRMCRDYLFRGIGADTTIRLWKQVREGEDKWIFPNQSKADIYLNTSVTYEQFVLKVYALPLLQQVPKESPCYSIARRMIRMLKPLLPIPVNLIPEMSTLCEFLPGGSQYEEFHF